MPVKFNKGSFFVPPAHGWGGTRATIKHSSPPAEKNGNLTIKTEFNIISIYIDTYGKPYEF